MESSPKSNFLEHNQIQLVDIEEFHLMPTSEAAPVAAIDMVCEKDSPEKNNEDSVFADPDRGVAGVFDGASDVIGFRTPDGMTGGAVASRIAARTLESSDLDRPFVEFLMEANEAINLTQLKLGLDPNIKEARFCTTGAAAKVRTNEDGRKVIDLLQIADSVAIVVYEDGGAEAPLGLYDHDEETMQLWKSMAAEGMTGSEIMQDDRMKAQIKSKRSESNVTYGVLNGEEDAVRFVRSITIPAEGVAKVILLSDGMFIPKEDPQTPDDWSVYAQLEEEGGVRAILEHVRAIEATDPDCVRYPRFKKNDDASGAVLDLRLSATV